jgi:outer membrane protein
MTRRLITLLALSGLAVQSHCQTTQGQQPPPESTQGLTPPIQPNLVPVQTPPSVAISPPPGAQTSTKPITAEDAGLLAVKHLPQVMIARAALKAARGRVLTAVDLLIPSISVNTGYLNEYYLNNGGSGRVFSNTGFSSSVTLSELIFDFGRTIDSVRQYQSLRNASGFALTAAESDAAFAAKQNFYAYFQALQNVDVAQANLSDTQSNLDLAKARLNSGLGTPADVVTAQTNVASSTVSLITARNAATQAELALTLSMGIDPRTPIVPADSAEKPLSTNDSNVLVDQALKQRPDVREMEANLRATGFEVSIARKALLPSVSLSAGVATNGQLQPFSTQAASYGLTLTWNPFDVVGYRGKLDIAEADRMTAQANLQQMVLTVVSQVSQAFVNEKNAEQQVAVSTSELANATEGLRIAEGQYRAGVVTFVTVIDAETNLSTARTDLVNAKTNLQTARAAMAHALGTPL